MPVVTFSESASIPSQPTQQDKEAVISVTPTSGDSTTENTTPVSHSESDIAIQEETVIATPMDTPSAVDTTLSAPLSEASKPVENRLEQSSVPEEQNLTHPETVPQSSLKPPTGVVTILRQGSTASERLATVGGSGGSLVSRECLMKTPWTTPVMACASPETLQGINASRTIRPPFIIYPPREIIDDMLVGVPRAIRRTAEPEYMATSVEARLAEYNSTLLYLNSHLKGTEDYHRLPFLKDTSGTVLFLPKGALLPNVYQRTDDDVNTATQSTITLPHPRPLKKDLSYRSGKHTKQAAQESSANTQKLSMSGIASRIFSCCAQPSIGLSIIADPLASTADEAPHISANKDAELLSIDSPRPDIDSSTSPVRVPAPSTTTRYLDAENTIA